MSYYFKEGKKEKEQEQEQEQEKKKKKEEKGERKRRKGERKRRKEKIKKAFLWGLSGAWRSQRSVILVFLVFFSLEKSEEKNSTKWGWLLFGGCFCCVFVVFLLFLLEGNGS